MEERVTQNRLSAPSPDEARLKQAHQKIEALIKNLNSVLRGKPVAVELTVTTLAAGGHLIIEDVPGVGKSTLAHAVAKSIDSDFFRIQFTSDLLPSDVIGVTVYHKETGEFEFRRGPIFANIVLADEINRATPRTQSALLEAMSVAQVSVERKSIPLPSPFMLIATENPMEFAGTYPLPESQLDRFMLSLKIGYPDRVHERAILTSEESEVTLKALPAVMTTAELLAVQEAAKSVRVGPEVTEYILEIAAATRTHKLIRLGVSPRGSSALYRAAQAHALVKGRDFVTPDDVKALARAVFAHRIIPVTEPTDERMDVAGNIIDELLATIAVP
ncbi:MAG: MoxR family ATPase [Proteobacteria bacterium]|nr:MoxR family ATPase [Pseudomonadota bacterium]